jgi:formylglycine-generating enzyme required for sulfatase activity
MRGIIRGACACLAATVLAPRTAPFAAESKPAPAEHGAALQALDAAIARYEALVAKIDDPQVGSTARGFLANYRERRAALEQAYDPTKYDELRFDVNVESHRLAQWLAPVRTPPRSDAEPRIITDLNLTLVRIPAGTFTMGRAPTGGRSAGDEGPATQVTISNAFWLGATEVTVGQWRAFAEATGYQTEAEKGAGIFVWKASAARSSTATGAVAAAGSASLPSKAGADPRFDHRPDLSWRNPGHAQSADHPVVGISWADANEFCAWLTARERAADRLPSGYVYTLPSEAQWEYACRAAGSEGTPAEEDVAWFAANSAGAPQPVGRKKPNTWGLYDMQGNVWEWCLDWYGPYPGGAVTDPTGPATGTVRESRGGGWNSSGGHGISATNRWNSPGLERRNNLGFRVALSLKP